MHRGSDWKVVAVAFTDDGALHGTSNEPVRGANTPGPLAALLAAPTELDAALASDPGIAVFGTDKREVAFGADAGHKLLAGWKAQMVCRRRALRRGVTLPSV